MKAEAGKAKLLREMVAPTMPVSPRCAVSWDDFPALHREGKTHSHAPVNTVRD